MDPVSLTAAVAPLTFTCAKIIKCFHAVKSTYQTAPVTVITMIAECATVSASLNQIQSLALNDPVALSSRMSPAGSLTKNFDDALTGCMLTLSVIEDELEGMVEGDLGAGTVGFKAKAKFIWNEAAMEALLRQLRGQQTAIGLLVAVLQTESIAEVKDMVQKNTATLQTMLQRARTLRESQASRPGTVGESAKPGSIFSFGMSSTVAGLAPDLSQQLHQSSAYQRARAVEMEDLWKRNHELLQEKYTLLERIEQLEEQEQKAAEELKTTKSKLEEKHRNAVNELDSKHARLQAVVQKNTASRFSSFEKSVMSAIQDHRMSTDTALKDRQKIDELESQLSDRRRALAELVASQEAESNKRLEHLLDSVRFEQVKMSVAINKRELIKAQPKPVEGYAFPPGSVEQPDHQPRPGYVYAYHPGPTEQRDHHPLPDHEYRSPPRPVEQRDHQPRPDYVYAYHPGPTEQRDHPPLPDHEYRSPPRPVEQRDRQPKPAEEHTQTASKDKIYEKLNRPPAPRRRVFFG
ncbi:MAG: hypothetical protein M1840_003606 [Geoglossum simile]|nr:MAG: hypothetical protein M1840_003606 [Geoglossum simile]